MTLTPSEQMANFASAIASECKAIHALINAAKEIKDSATGTGTTWSSSKISSELTAAKNEVKNDLLGGAGAAYDTLKELRDLIASNASSIEALEALAAGHVRFNAAQTLTDTEKAQARSNIGAAAQSSLSSVDSRLSIAESGLASVTTTANSTKSTVESLSTTVSTKANDKAVVKLSGDQTIAGTKTFSSTISGSISGNAATATKATQDGSGNVITSTYAPLASPTFTGTPKAPTAAAGTNTTQVATTAFVTTAVANKTSVASATKATQDGSGNVITSTYATKTELTNGLSDKATTAWVQTFVSNALSGISGASVAQVGDIKLFHGSLGGSDGRRPVDGVTGMVDEAWELCDGTNGTPDMRGKLAYGAGGTLAVGAAHGAAATNVDKAGFDYALGTRSGQTTTTVLTSPPQGVGLYYLKKTS